MDTNSATVETTVPSTSTPPKHELSGKEARAKNLAINGDKPRKALPGNTFPIRQLLWVLGSKWDAEAKVQMVPEHTYQQASDALAHVNKLIADKKAESAARKANPAPAKPKPVATPKATVNGKDAAAILAERKLNLAKARLAKAQKDLEAMTAPKV